MFLRQWQNAGWDVSSRMEFAGTIRPLQYRDDLDDEFIDEVTKEDLLKCVTKLYAKQTFTMVMQSDVENFIEVVHRHFSKPNAVLLPKSHDVYTVQGLQDATSHRVSYASLPTKLYLSTS